MKVIYNFTYPSLEQHTTESWRALLSKPPTKVLELGTRWGKPFAGEKKE